jgi:toxin ParE1/3/4
VTLSFSFHPSVRDEVDEAYRWYEARKVGLGDDFVAATDQVLAEIATNPQRYGFADLDIREGLLTRFPFAVYYRVLANQIRVLAVYHTSRHPSGWQSRS